MTRNALGRGLGALIREPEPAAPAPLPTPIQSDAKSAAAVAPAMGGQQLIDIDLIEPSPYQPRTHFGDTALEELAQSIKASGIIQPLVLRPIGARYQLLAGERRWRAAQRAGLARVPAVLRQVTDEAALEITLVENIQREDLSPIEEARAFERMMSEFSLTQEDVAIRTGKDRATVANSVRLLRLEKNILDLIEDGRLSAGHGRALLAIADPVMRSKLALRASRGGLTVRQIERLSSRRSRILSTAVAPAIDANTRAALEELQQALGTKVTLRPSVGRKPGELVIEYYDDAQLAGIYERIVS